MAVTKFDITRLQGWWSVFLKTDRSSTFGVAFFDKSSNTFKGGNSDFYWRVSFLKTDDEEWRLHIETTSLNGLPQQSIFGGHPQDNCILRFTGKSPTLPEKAGAPINSLRASLPLDILTQQRRVASISP